MTPRDHRVPDGASPSTGDAPTSRPAKPPAVEHRAARVETVTFESQGVRCVADLYVPTGGAPPWPAVVMAHGFAGERTWGLAPFAERFAANGFVAFVFDYRHLGGSDGTPRRLVDPRRQLDDWAAAFARARSLETVDPDRVALWGTSFGGGHALATARRESDVAAVVAQVPYVDGPATVAHQTRNRSVLARTRLAVRALADRAGAALGTGPVEVPIVTEPGEGGLLDSPGALSGFRSVVPENETLVNRTPARVALDLSGYRPGRGADEIAAPVHVVVAERDRLLPLSPTERLLERLENPSVHRIAAGHFDVHHDPWFGPVVDEQVAFLSAASSVDD